MSRKRDKQTLPVGLQVLSRHDQLRLTYQSGFCCVGAQYKVQSGDKRLLMTAEEDSAICRSESASEISVYAYGNHGFVLDLSRESRSFNDHKMFVAAPGFGSIGVIKQSKDETTGDCSKYEVNRSRGEKVFTISQMKSPESQNFEIFASADGANKIGLIKRKSHLGTDMKWDIRFPKRADIMDKTLLLSAAFLLSYVEEIYTDE